MCWLLFLPKLVDSMDLTELCGTHRLNERLEALSSIELESKDSIHRMLMVKDYWKQKEVLGKLMLESICKDKLQTNNKEPRACYTVGTTTENKTVLVKEHSKMHMLYVDHKLDQTHDKTSKQHDCLIVAHHSEPLNIDNVTEQSQRVPRWRIN
jgi:hypothetical protein